MAQQRKIFDTAPEGVRKVVVSTNIAETSVTIGKDTIKQNYSLYKDIRKPIFLNLN